MMYHMHSKQTSLSPLLPTMNTKPVYHIKQDLVIHGIIGMPSKPCSLDIRYVFDMVLFSGWTPPKQHRAGPLNLLLFPERQKRINSPHRHRSAELDHAIYGDYIFCAERSNICPTGNTGRVISNSMVERFRFDGACKARLICFWSSIKLFIAGAMKSSHGSFVFYWGKKPSRILALRSQIENRISHLCAGAQSLLCSAWADHSSEKPTRLNALRVAECNFAF